MMPEGLLDGLSNNDTRDLLAYLSSPEQVAHAGDSAGSDQMNP